METVISRMSFTTTGTANTLVTPMLQGLPILPQVHRQNIGWATASMYILPITTVNRCVRYGPTAVRAGLILTSIMVVRFSATIRREIMEIFQRSRIGRILTEPDHL